MKLLSAITMITMITFLLVVSTTSSVLSYSDFTLDRYREQDQTIRHGKSKFINLQPLTVSSSQCFHRSSNVSTSHKREEQPRLRGRGMFRIKKFKSRGNFRAVEKKYPLQFENYKSVTGKCRIVFCKNIYSAKLCAQKYINSDISGGINGTGGAKNDRGGGKNVKLSLSGSHCDWRS